MVVGHAPEWWTFFAAVGHVERSNGITTEEAAKLLSALLYDGKIASRYSGVPGREGRIAAKAWHKARLWLSDGMVEFAGDPRFPRLSTPLGLGRPRHHVELRRADVLRWTKPNLHPLSNHARDIAVDAARPDEHYPPTPVGSSLPKPAPTDVVKILAEWVFARHHVPPRLFKDLFNEARGETSLGTFRRRQFEGAFRRVYQTAPHRPPVTGWPLREPYSDRWCQGKGKKK
jgi:hypothetical protein